MTIVSRSDVAFKLSAGSRPRSPESTMDEGEASVGELMKAAFSIDNTVGSAIFSEDGLPSSVRRTSDINFEFDPFDEIDGYEQFADSFVKANTREEVDSIKRQIDNEVENRELLASNGFMGVTAQVAAGIFDPINLIPVGGTAFKAYSQGGSILRNAAAVGYAGVLAAGTAEVGLRASQETRTIGEGVANITAGAFLGGVLGAGAGAISRNSFLKLSKQLDEDLTIPKPEDVDLAEPSSIVVTQKSLEDDLFAWEGGSASAAKVRETTLTEETLVKSYGTSKAIEKLPQFLQTPIHLLSTSPVVTPRRFVQMLVETPYEYEKNALGFSNPVSVETTMSMWDAPLAKVIKGHRDIYKRYKDRVKQEGGKPLKWNEFKTNISRSRRRKDQHDVPEVAEASRLLSTELFQPMKNRIIDSGLWNDLNAKVDDVPKGKSVNKIHADENMPDEIRNAQKSFQDKTDDLNTDIDNYLTRMYDREKITAQRSEFTAIIENWLRSMQRQIDDEFDAEDVAEQVVDNILTGTGEGRLPYDLPMTKRGPLKARTLWRLPDELVEEFLENDVEIIARAYVKTVAPDIAIKDQFGTLDLFGENGTITIAVKEDYRKLNERIDKQAKLGKITTAEATKRKIKLGRRRDSDLMQLEGTVGRLRGTYGIPEDPDSTLVRFGRQVRNLQSMTKLGGILPSSIADIGRVVTVNGFQRAFGDAIIPAIKSIKKDLNSSGFKLAKSELKLAAIGFDPVLAVRSQRIVESDEGFIAKGTFIERGLDSLTDTFFRASMINQWTGKMKEWSGHVAQQRILRAIKSGKPSKRDIAYMRKLGISELQQEKIGKELSKHGRVMDGLEVAGLENWDSTDAFTAFTLALKKETNIRIITPSAGDRPLWMSSEMGKVVGQFRSFTFSATNKILIAGLQEVDRENIGAYIGLITAGMMSYALKTMLAGRELSDDPRVWISEGVDRSGMLGVVSDLNNIVEKATRGKVGINALIGGEPMSRYASRNAVGAIFGATLGTMYDIGNLTGALSTGEWNNQDVRALRRMIPFQNFIGIRRIFDQIEEGFAESVGVKKRKKSKKRKRI